MTLTPFVFDITLFTTTLMTLLVIMDPIGTVPVFLALTGRLTAPKQKSAARQATSVSLGIIIAFAILGGQILRFLQISVDALRLSGGVLLFLVAMELLMGSDSSTPDTGDDAVNVALVPLGTPLLAGPGAIVAVMVAVGQAGASLSGWLSVLSAVALASGPGCAWSHRPHRPSHRQHPTRPRACRSSPCLLCGPGYDEPHLTYLKGRYGQRIPGRCAAPPRRQGARRRRHRQDPAG